MILYEFEGKELLKKAGINVPKSFLCHSGLDPESREQILKQVQDDVGIPCVLKAQVLSGKRADMGGIVMVEDNQDTRYKIQELFGKTINGEKVEKVLVEEKVQIESEYYLSISYDTETRSPILSLSLEGGTGIEERKVDVYSINPLDRTVQLPHNITIAPFKALIDLFFDQDCLLLEINPLVTIRTTSVIPAQAGIQLEGDIYGSPIRSGMTNEGKADNAVWMALDAKIKLDDDARRRHEDWNFPPRSVAGRVPTENEIAARKIDEEDYRGTAGSAYFDLEGDIAVLSSGGGVSLTAMDALIKAGGKPANFTEYSGNPPKEKVTKLTKIVLNKPNIHGLWVIGTVAANFTDIYETLTGLIEGLREAEKELNTKFDFPIVIRRGGPRQEEAYQMLREIKDFNITVQGEENSITESAQVMAEKAREYAQK